MANEYYSERHGVTFKIVGYFGRTKTHETYHARNARHGKDLILHLLRSGCKRRYPGVKKIDSYERKVEGKMGMLDEQATPWRKENHVGYGGGE